MERSEDELRRSPDLSSATSSHDEGDESSGSTPPPEAAEVGGAVAAAAAVAADTSEVKHMAASTSAPVLSTKAQPLREPLPRQMYRGSNSDTQLNWGTKLAWESQEEESAANASPTSQSPAQSSSCLRFIDLL